MAEAPAQRSNTAIVFFDIETAGFFRNDDILQIAMRCGNADFNRYAIPTKPISRESTLVHGLTYDGSDLYLHGMRVKSSPLNSILIDLLNFLRSKGDSCILVAHNSGFDSSRLLIKIKKFRLLDEFRQVVVGFSDSLSMLKRKFPDRKGKGSFKLTNLAADLLNISPEEAQACAHDAMYDVEILAKLINNYIPYDTVVRSAKSFDSLVETMHRKEESIFYLRTLRPLARIVSKQMLERMAYARITYESLLNEYQKGEQYVINLLENGADGKTRVTKSTRILNDILRHLRDNCNN